MDDEELIAAVAGGDEGALRELFSRHAGWVCARLRRLVPVDAVEDVLQETFVGVWQGARRYRAEGRAGAWVWGIGLRQAALWLRRNRRIGEVEWPDNVEPVSADNPEEVALDRVEPDRALATLGPAGSLRRQLWRLLFVEDRPEAEVAARLGVARGTVKSRAHRMRQALRAAPSHPQRPKRSEGPHLTTFDLDEYVYDAIRAGASGFLLKDVIAERLFDAVRVVAAGADPTRDPGAAGGRRGPVQPGDC